MTRHTLITLVALQLLSFTDAATQVALPSFQAAPVTLPSACQSIYNSAIGGCTTDDFLTTSTCSSNCRTGLVQIQLLLNLRCNGVEVDDTTLLGRIFSGDILNALCPSRTSTTSASAAKATTTSSSTKASSTTSVSVSSSTQVTQATQKASTTKQTTPAVTLSTRPVTLSTSTSISTSSTSSAQSAAISSSTSGLQSAGNGIGDPTGILATPSNTVSVSSTPVRQVTAQTQLSMRQKQIAAMANTGGGSPFDIIDTSGAERLVAGWTMIISFVWIAWVMGG